MSRPVHPIINNCQGTGWTLKKLVAWVEANQKRDVCRNTIRKLFQKCKLSWEKCKKLLARRDPVKRAEHMVRFDQWYEHFRQGKIRLIYVDESHFHRDMDFGYSWGPVGKLLWRPSNCPQLSDGINLYVANNFTDGQCLIWNEGHCNAEHTAAFLERLKAWLPADGRKIVVIWDGTPWHRAKLAKAADLGIELVAPPGYSPDLNPIEGLWKWKREEVINLRARQTCEPCSTPA